jgi:glycosyltransferase involved in cell wall biosynthesis
LLSVITVCLNAADSIDKTLGSYQEQTAEDTELIVIDGGSTDQTPAILRRFKDCIDVLVEEPDDGIAAAMNKGLSRSSGDYVLFLHADDYLVDAQVLDRIRPWLDGQSEIVAMDLMLGSGDQLKRCRSRGFGYWSRFKTPFLHQATICQRDLFARIGPFDEGFKVCMDFDFFLRAYREGASCRHEHELLTVMGDQGLSSLRDWPAVRARLREEFAVQRKNMRSRVELIWYWPWWLVYPIYKRLSLALG